MRTTARRSPALLVCAALVVAGTVACSAADDEPARPAGQGQQQSSAQEAPAEADPDQPLPWGPTAGELAEARELVSGWTSEQLAGQVIVGRFHGTDPAEAARLVRDLHLAGVSVTSENVTDEAQVRTMTRAVGRAAAADGRDFPAVIGVDQEGGVVSHLRGIATEFPSFATAGQAVTAGGPAGRAAVRRAAYTTGLELRDLGFTWVFAPVADVTIGAADPTIGSRSASSDPATAAAATVAAVGGFDDAGVVSTTKHFPGHGSVTADSHETLPVLGATLAALRQRDLVPFADAVDAGAPAVMVGHLDVSALAPGVPSTLAPEVYALLRDDLGFEGVTLTDSLGMGAVAGLPRPAVRALNAGADMLLMPADTRHTHGVVTAAIESGDVSRERAEEAAAQVVALQLWQQRTAGEVPVPADASEQAAAAAAALSAAAYG